MLLTAFLAVSSYGYAAGQQNRIQFFPDSIHVEPGEHFTLSVMVTLDDTSAINGAGMHLDFDRSRLVATRLAEGDLLPLVLKNDLDNGNGKIDFAAGTFGTVDADTFVLAVLEFQAGPEPGVAGIQFDTVPPRMSGLVASGKALPTSLMAAQVFVGEVTTASEDLSRESIRIYPNPATDLIQIKTRRRNGQVFIYNQMGVPMYAARDKDWHDISFLPPGTYVVSYGNKISRFIKI